MASRPKNPLDCKIEDRAGGELSQVSKLESIQLSKLESIIDDALLHLSGKRGDKAARAIEQALDGMTIVELIALRSGDYRKRDIVARAKLESSNKIRTLYGRHIKQDAVYAATVARIHLRISGLVSDLLPTLSPAQKKRIEGVSHDKRPLSDRIVDCLTRTNEPLNNTEIAMRLGVHPVTVARLMPELRREARVVSRRNGSEILNSLPDTYDGKNVLRLAPYERLTPDISLKNPRSHQNRWQYLSKIASRTNPASTKLPRDDGSSPGPARAALKRILAQYD